MIKLYINAVKMSIENTQVEIYFSKSCIYTQLVGLCFENAYIKMRIVGQANMNKL